MVCWLHGLKAVDFRVWTAVLRMKAFPDDAMFVHQHSAYHGIGRNVASPQLGQFEATLHV
jgi:hypothetical protein